MNPLPCGWAIEPLVHVADVVMGQSPPGESYNADGDGTPFFQGKAEFTSLFAEVRKWTKAGTKFAKQGDILLSVRAPVGPTNLAPVDCAIGRGLAAIRAKDHMDQKYLLWALRASEPSLAAKGTGTTFSAISGKTLRQHPIPTPPIDEQRRIVDILEDHLSRLDAADAELEALPRRLRALDGAQAVRMFCGNGLPAGPESVALGDHTMSVPNGWRTSNVGTEADLVEYGTSAKTHATCGADDVPVIRMGNLQGGQLVLDKLAYLPRSHPDVSAKALEPGDLLFNRTNSAELVGKSAVYYGVGRPVTFASYLIRVRFGPNVEPDWANLLINSPLGRRHIASVASQQVGQANVNGTKLKAFPLLLPPRDVQRQMLDEFRSWKIGAARLQAGANQGRARCALLRRALLDAAFSGRLTGRSSDLECAEEMIVQ